MQYDAIVISDLHLGARNCEAKKIRKFLHRLKRGKISTKLLIIAGDGTDVQDVKRLRKRHRKVLKMIRKLKREMLVIKLSGNHDPDPKFDRKHYRVEVLQELIFQSGGKRIFVSHGHHHDDFLEEHPIIVNLADAIYGISQMVDPSHKLARLLKRRSKKFLKAVRKIGCGVAADATTRGCQIAVHGHNHHAGRAIINDMEVWDCGSWTERPCTFWSIKDGIAAIHEFK